MHRALRFAALIPLLMAASSDLMTGRAVAQSQGKAKGKAIADPSNWELVITHRDGGQQKGAIRLRNGTIYPAIADIPSGSIQVDGEGRLHIYFTGHPKVYNGEAVLSKVVPGRWEGSLDSSIGQSRIEMKRK